MSGQDRLTRAVLGDGTEPDPRFTLANERTFLAWIRTSLALLAGGVALAAVGSGIFGPERTRPLVATLIVLAMVLSAASAWRWAKVERALRRGSPLPLNTLGLMLAAAVTLIAAGIGVMYLVGT